LSGLLREEDWEILTQRIAEKKCTPFLGAGASAGLIPLGGELAREWAAQYGYPLDDPSDLVRVAQYLALTKDPMFPKEEIVRKFRKLPAPDFTDPAGPHRVLAALPLPVYITTNYDDFMSQALAGQHKDPRRELCRWNKFVKDYPSAFDEGFTPTVANPVVFHLHGQCEVAESLVLTEDDYMDFLVNLSVDEQLLPAPIARALTGSSLLFIGYRLGDWNFRVLLRGLSRFMEKGLRRTHYAVMPPPAVADGVRERAQNYLAEYYDNIDVRVYWGTAVDFLKELKGRSQRA
jgi:SIR2-like domain